MIFEDFDPKEIEPEILEFWNENKVLEQIEEKNKDGEKFYFLQGPPYTSGEIHLGQAWNHAMKDMILRYKRMQGYNVWNRGGYDMHGLPTAHKVMDKNDLNTKAEIQEYGIENFVKDCKDFSNEMADQMSEDLNRLGITLDFENAYKTLENDYIESVWHLIKQVDKKDRLYKGQRTLLWCPSCETTLAKHEAEYEDVTDQSIFVKFPIKGKEDEYLVIWTTTPWTIIYNLCVMVNPDLDYVKAEVDNGEKWIVAKDLSIPLIKGVANKDFETIEEFKGEELDGTEYIHPWNDKISKYEEMKKENDRIHTVVMSEQYVTTEAGSGLVHCAPGCGREDYEIGHEYDMPAFNTVNQSGEITGDLGEFAGLKARSDDEKFIEKLDETGKLIATSDIEHDYPHCDRCSNSLIFRTTPQWFFQVEDLKDDLLEKNKESNWIPQKSKHAFKSWLENLRDNSITRQRYWGTPVPIWICNNCEDITVIGSKEELKEKTEGEVPEDLHRPWIDQLSIECEECNSTKERVEDVLDVWIDPGTASWNCLYYPQKQEYFEEWFPADFILEGKDQIRGWFNFLMICSKLGLDEKPFENVYMHGFVTDVDGEKMSKSIGNIISPYEVIDKHGADTLRYYMSETNAGEDINFSWEEAKIKERHLNILWNIHKFLTSMTKENNDQNPYKLNNNELSFDNEEKYIFSRLNNTIKEATRLFDEYKLDEVIKPIENLFLDLSRTYMQIVRSKSNTGTREEKQTVMYTIGHTLLQTLKIFSPIAPFTTEAIYQNLKQEYNLEKESIHLYEWPKTKEEKIDGDLEKNLEKAQDIIKSVSRLRQQSQISNRWPLQEVIIETENDEIKESIKMMKDIIKRQTNVKEINIVSKMSDVEKIIEPDYSVLGPKHGKQVEKVAQKLSNQDPDNVISEIEENNYYQLEEGLEINREDFEIKTEVPEEYNQTNLNKESNIYINKERNKDLMIEGYANELMRHIQQQRKENDLEKKDDIRLYVKTSSNMKERLEVFEEQISDRVGATEIKINDEKPNEEYQFSSEEEIKEEIFEIYITKVS